MRPDEALTELDEFTSSPEHRDLVRALVRVHDAAARDGEPDDVATQPSAALERDLLLRHAALYGAASDGSTRREPQTSVPPRSTAAATFEGTKSQGAPSFAHAPGFGTLANTREDAARRWFGRGSMPLRSVLLAVVLAAGASVGACTIPAEYDAPLGWTVELALPAGREVSVDEVLEAMAEFSGSEQLNVMLSREHDTDPLRLSLQIWASDADADATVQRLIERVPALREAPFERRPLVGTIHTSLAGELGFRLLGRSNPHELGRARDELRRHMTVDVRQITTATRTTDGARETLEIRVERRVVIESSTSDTRVDEHVESTTTSPITF